jgi:hypothetical protein
MSTPFAPRSGLTDAAGPRAGPRIVMTLLVRDEEDILVQNIEYHRALGVDHFIITDNLSKDRTPSIIQHYVRKGWASSIFEIEDDYSQSDWVTRMARMAVRFDADWVINSDADEFWAPSRGSLKDFYDTVPVAADVVVIPRCDFVYLGDLAGVWYQQMIYRKSVSLNHIGLPLPPKIAHRASADVTVHQGNHGVDGLSGSAVTLDGLEILHFPIRSKAQFENKIRNGGAAYARNSKLPPTVARGWRSLYATYASEGSLDSYLASHCFTPDQIAAAIASGAMRVDARLAEFDFSDASFHAWEEIGRPIL